MTIEREAINALRSKGWVKGAFVEDYTGSVCAVGAISRAAIPYPWDEFRDTLKRVAGVAQEQYPERIDPTVRISKCEGREVSVIASFNDHPETTQDDVERVLTKAAIEAEEQA